MVVQAFLLDSSNSGYSDFLIALANFNAAHYNFTPAQIVRDASHNSSLKVVFANVSNTEINSNTFLTDARIGTYPTPLCRHRWSSLDNFRALGGFHMINESVRSYELDNNGYPMNNREMLFVRPQQGIGDSSGTGTLQNYGNGDGTTHYDALNGMQDPAIDKNGLGECVWNKGYSYVICDGGHVRWGNHDNGANPDSFNGVSAQGLLAVEDATANANNKIYIYGDWDLMPGMVLGGYTSWERFTSLPWELYDSGNSIYVLGHFNDGASVTSLTQTTLGIDADVDDITADMVTFTKNHVLKGHAILANLQGASGMGRFHVQDNNLGADQDWDGVHVWDTSSFTDVTSNANSAASNDFEILASSAPDNSYIAFVDAVPFSVIRINLAQAQAGGTGIWEYSQGSNIWGTFSNSIDDSSNFTVGTSTYDFEFNPKIDWALENVNGTEGYAVRWRKTGGTVTIAARGDQITRRSAACFVHRWNNSAPTRGMCHWGVGNGPHIGGFCWVLNGKGNVEFVRLRLFARGQWEYLNDATPITWTGCQWGLIGSMGSSGSPPRYHTFKEAIYGSRFWNITDHFRQDKTHAGIQRILNLMQQAIDNGETTTPDGNPIDLTAFDNMGNWSDFFALGTGIYGSGGIEWHYTVDGCKWRYVGAYLQGLNDENIINLETGDKHCIATYGGTNGNYITMKKIGIENHTLAIDFYPQGTGDYDYPVAGKGTASVQNLHFSYGYCDTWNKKVDTGQPVHSFSMEGDNDAALYEGGFAGQYNNSIWFWESDDETNGSNTSATGFATSHRGIWKSPPWQLRYYSFNNLFEAWAVTGNWGPAATNLMTYDGASTYYFETQNVKSTGGTFSAVHIYNNASASFIQQPSEYVTTKFDANTGNGTGYFEGLITTATDNSYISFISGKQFDLMPFNVGIAQTGATGTWEYSQGSNTWNAISGVSDSSSGFTSTGDKSLTFTIPGDWALENVNGTEGYAIRWRKTGGSFSTLGTASLRAVYTWNTSAFTDVTTDSNDTGINDFTVLAASAPDGSYIAFIDDQTFSGLQINLAQVQIGGTGVWEYSQGGGTYSTLSATDPSSGFTSGTSSQNLTFTPPSDWVMDTVNGTTGYIIRWRKTGGTVTQAATGDQINIAYGIGMTWAQVKQQVPVFPTGATGEIAYFGSDTRFHRRFYINTNVAGVGSPTLVWEYYNGSTWIAVNNLSDATSGFTVVGQQVVTFDKEANVALANVNGMVKYWSRCRISSGSFSTVPKVDDIRATIYGGAIDIKHYEVRKVPFGGKVGVQYGGNWNIDTTYILDDYGNIHLEANQSASTNFYRLINGGNANETFATYRSRTKLANSTCADLDSVFNPNGNLV